ncbi:pilus assembly protein PilM [Paraferrimonas sedimenticola]|nr:pilus assembly protein PilM [Paraferrimonas sedimenticola]
MLLKMWKRTAPQMVGIDIGSHEVKAIMLSSTADGYKISGHACAPLRKGVVVNHEIKDVAAVVEALQQVKRRLPNSIKHAAVAVSGSAVMTKVIYMDAALSEDEREAHIEIEADNLIPYPLDEVNIDFEVLGPNSSDPTKVDVLLSACRTENVDTRVDALADVDLEAKVVDVEGYVLGRSFELIREQLPEQGDNQVVAMVDVGASMTTIAIVANGETQFVREQAFGGEEFTQAIISFYGMSYEQAEQAKQSGELPENYEFEVLSPFQTQLLQQIKRTLQIYCTSSGREQIDHIVLSGGTARLEGLAKLLTNDLGINTLVANPFQGRLHASSADSERLSGSITKYMIAAGLALRSYGQWRT